MRVVVRGRAWAHATPSWSPAFCQTECLRPDAFTVVVGPEGGDGRETALG